MGSAEEAIAAARSIRAEEEDKERREVHREDVADVVHRYIDRRSQTVQRLERRAASVEPWTISKNNAGRPPQRYGW